MVVLEAAVGAALQQQPHGVHLTSATGAVQRRVPAVRLAVDITATLNEEVDHVCIIALHRMHERTLTTFDIHSVDVSAGIQQHSG